MAEKSFNFGRRELRKNVPTRFQSNGFAKGGNHAIQEVSYCVLRARNDERSSNLEQETQFHLNAILASLRLSKWLQTFQDSL